MKALAWDDEVDAYIKSLKEHLKSYKINLEITENENHFIERFNQEKWDFVVLDYLQKDSPTVGKFDAVGARLANGIMNWRKGKHLPIFMITKHFDRLHASEVGLPPSVILKSKSTRSGWMASEIYHTLKERGVYVDTKKVFLIYGHDRDTDGSKGRVEHFLRKRNIDVVMITGRNLQTEIIGGLLEEMNDCAAMVAICTPDDERADGTFWPRPNVFLEIGIAMGLSRGLQRLTILQRWGPDLKNQAQMPSDMGGVLSIRFEGIVDNILADLESRLKDLEVDL